MAHNDRHSRQRLLPEIGDAGQERLMATEFVARSDVAPAVRKSAELYAAACGFPPVGPFERSVEGEPAMGVISQFRHEAARDLAAGASCVVQAVGRAVRDTGRKGAPPSEDKV